MLLIQCRLYILYPNPHSWINGGGKLPVPATVQLLFDKAARRHVFRLVLRITCTVIVIMKLGLREEITSKHY